MALAASGCAGSAGGEADGAGESRDGAVAVAAAADGASTFTFDTTRPDAARSGLRPVARTPSIATRGGCSGTFGSRYRAFRRVGAAEPVPGTSITFEVPVDVRIEYDPDRDQSLGAPAALEAYVGVQTYEVGRRGEVISAAVTEHRSAELRRNAEGGFYEGSLPVRLRGVEAGGSQRLAGVALAFHNGDAWDSDGGAKYQVPTP